MIAGKSTLNYPPATTCNYNLPAKDPNYLLTVGKIYEGPTRIKTDPAFKQSTSNTMYLLQFCNAYNIDAFSKGLGQLILSTRLNANGELKPESPGYIDLVSEPVIDPNTLYLYSQEVAGIVKADTDRQNNTTQTGGTDAALGHFAAEFGDGSDTLTPAIQAEVARAVELCLAQFPAGQRPNKFTLTSGASTEYGKKQMPFSKGVGPVAVTTTDETKNQDLAYRRGLAFMTALNAGLLKKDHPGFGAYEIAWSIGASGKPENSADRFVDLNISQNAVKPKVKETNTADGTQTGSAVVSIKEKGQFYEHRLTLTAAESK